MRVGRWAAVVVLAAMVATLAWAESAKSLYNKGRDAEARQNYEQAYDFYKQAYDMKPKELKYRSAFLRMRFQSAASHVTRGQKLRADGKLQEALAEFTKAYEIDPSSFVAQQEVKATKDLIERQQNPQAAPPKSDQLQKRIDEAAGPVDLSPISETPITLQLTEDSKVIYETIGKLAGINVLFDPDYTSRRIKIALNGVTLNQALDILALESKTFWRPVTANTIFVASDTPAKRKELEQSVIKTFYLSNLSQPTELQDVVNAMRTILEVNRVQQLPSQGAIVVRGTPDQVALAEKLVEDIDKARPEVVVDVVVMQVSLDNLRHLGVQPPASASIQLQGNVNSTTTTAGTSTGTGTATGTTTTGTTPGVVTLNKLANLDANDFQVTIPSATANFLFDDTTTKIIQQPQIRALDGQKASLKIGERIPVATGSFQPGIGGVGINPLVNTQFQYIDVGVNIDVTPRVHADQEISLKMMLEISSVTGQQNIGGISQPIIGQRKVEHEIRLREGEVNLLGGILEDSDFKEWTGLPGLGNIPLLRYFFATHNTERRTNEIVFALVPHIVRRQTLSALNLKTVDVGTANAIDLRRVTKPENVAAPAGTPQAAPPTSPQGNVPGMPPGAAPQQAPQGGVQVVPPTAVPQQAPQAQPQQTTPQQQPGQQPPQAQPQQPQGQPQQQPQTQEQPQAQPPPTSPPQTGLAVPPGVSQPEQMASLKTEQPPVGGSAAKLSFDPPSVNQAVGSTFLVNVKLDGARDVYAVPVQITYDPHTLELVNISNGGLLSKDGQAVALVHRDDPDGGSVQVSASRPPGTPGVSGDGVVYSLTFMAKAPGTSMIAIARPGIRNSQMQSMAVQAAPATITVH